ncbi:sulfotransferase family protein [Marinobacter sp.]|uniref:sulfotransferase family protein n=1 Tax=Marinobacter sp. TaxID=50741 RepID=UPI0038517468
MKPNFIVIGAARSGTTSLFQYLDPHPEVFMSQVKELNFFSNEKYWNKGFKWYESQFAGADQRTQAIGEASTSYTKAPFTQDVVKRIHDYKPDMKLIYVVRDPIDRYISHYMKRVQTGIETRTFDQTLENLENEACAWQGRYHYQIQNYLERFPRDQLLVISMASMKTSPKLVMEDVYNFLGLQTLGTISGLDAVHNATHRVIRKNKAGSMILRLGGLQLQVQHSCRERYHAGPFLRPACLGRQRRRAERDERAAAAAS